jgi:hypothetical protein
LDLSLEITLKSTQQAQAFAGLAHDAWDQAVRPRSRSGQGRQRKEPRFRETLFFAAYASETGENRIDLVQQVTHERRQGILIQEMEQAAEQVPQEVSRAGYCRDVNDDLIGCDLQAQDVDEDWAKIQMKNRAVLWISRDWQISEMRPPWP